MNICFVITDSINLHSLYRDQFRFLKSHSVSVTAIASPGKEHSWIEAQAVRSVPINISRQPHVLKDFISLIRIWWFFIFNRFDLIVVSTPKASLIGSLAARLAFQKRLVFMIRGRAYENMRGVKREFFRLMDKITCGLSDRVQSISKELAESYVEEGICASGKIIVLGLGSSNGVDLSKFDPDFHLERRHLVRRDLGVKDSSFVFMYCGRVRRDKGIDELVAAFQRFLSSPLGTNEAVLLIVGSYELFDPLKGETIKFLTESRNVCFVEWARHVEPYFSAADVFVFPSHREGFGNVALEASAMSLPVIAFDVVGSREAVEADRSGLLVEAFSVEGLFQAMVRLYESEELRRTLGSYGRRRVEHYFDSEVVWRRLLRFYNEVVG